MKKQLEQVLINEDYLMDKIYIIRGQKVMLDSDLARIYGYTLSAFNQQVRNNKYKFDTDFMFQITKEEYINLKSKKLTSSWGGVRKLPYVFTESGIYMLMTVLKGPLAIKQSKALIRTFKAMKDYIIENRELILTGELELRTQLLERDVKDINIHLDKVDYSLNKVISNFNDPSTYKHYLIKEGRKLDADIAYRNIFKQAKSSIIYIDDYVGLKTLELLAFASKKVLITIISDNKSKELKEYMMKDFIKQRKADNLSILKSNNKCHDRFIILDFDTNNEIIYHCGASSKDAGNRITTMNRLDDTNVYRKTIFNLLKHKDLFK